MENERGIPIFIALKPLKRRLLLNAWYDNSCYKLSNILEVIQYLLVSVIAQLDWAIQKKELDYPVKRLCHNGSRRL